MIKYEEEICKHLNIPSIPKKEWNKKDSFKTGVAITKLALGGEAFAVCTFDVENDKEPRVIKSFANEPFYGVEKVFVLPNYMETDVEKFDLDEESKKKAEEIIKEAKELTKEKTQEDKQVEEMQALPEWVFPEITNVDEARAWLSNWNNTHKIKGKIPTNEETIKMRLLNIYSQMKNKKK